MMGTQFGLLAVRPSPRNCALGSSNRGLRARRMPQCTGMPAPMLPIWQHWMASNSTRTCHTARRELVAWRQVHSVKMPVCYWQWRCMAGRKAWTGVYRRVATPDTPRLRTARGRRTETG